MKTSKLIGFEVHLVHPTGCSTQTLTLPIGAALEICAHCEGAVIKLVPVYELSPVSETETKD